MPITLKNPDSSCALMLQDVTVARGDFVLCEGVNLCLQMGQICHVIGKNGLGKTTLLYQIAKLLPTIKGKILHCSPTPPACVFHQTGIHSALTVYQNLQFLAQLYTDDDTQLLTALDAVGLLAYKDVAVAKLSAGQTKKVALARLFLDLPVKLWLLDEPLTALDVAMVDVLQARLHKLSQTAAVLLTSHQPIAVKNCTLDLADFV